MARRLPPLNGLRAFEATGRHLSFKKAADELFVTPAAVSQQVRLLEERTSRKLFDRLPHGLALTEAGAAAMPMLSHALDLMELASEALVAGGATERFAVSAPTSFASRWLVPRLSAFQAVAPNAQPQIDADDTLADFAKGGVELAIRFGMGAYHGLDSAALFPAVFVPVCSPALVAKNGGLSKPSDLARYRLIHRTNAPENVFAPGWELWLKLAGAPSADQMPSAHVSSSALAVDAALAGQGVALAASSLVWRDVQRGALVAPLSRYSKPIDRLGYYLVRRSDAELSPPASAFSAWILEEARSEWTVMTGAGV